jgi:hypothetical protein
VPSDCELFNGDIIPLLVGQTMPPFIHLLVPDPKMTTSPWVNCLTSPVLPNTVRCLSHFAPTSKSKQVESEVWLFRLGSPGVHQLNILPGNVTGLPLVLNTTPLGSSTLRNRLGFASRPLNVRRYGRQIAGGIFTWTLGSCVLPPQTILIPRKVNTELFDPTMGLPPTC